MLPALSFLLVTLSSISSTVHVGIVHFSGTVPDFIHDQSIKARYEYEQILENTTLTVQEANQSFKSWAAEYNLTTAYKAYQANQTVIQQEFDKNVTNVITNLSNLNGEVLKILNNQELSIQEQRAAVKELDETYSKELPTLLFIRQLFNKNDILAHVLDN